MQALTERLTATLFQPFSFGGQQLPNRLVMAPMTRNHSPDGIPTEEVATYYRRRAEGGIGLIITEGTYINHPSANGYPNVPAFYGEKALAGWKHVVDEVHAAGGKIIPQLWHVGLIRRPGTEPDPSIPGVGPMEIQEEGKVVVRAMTQADINAIIEAFAQAAKDAERIGFDGIELHGAHEYLLDNFLWEGTNQREDKYGGSIENRVRFPVEIVKAVRAVVSKDFPIVFRFSQWKQRDYAARLANTPDELKRILQPLADAGVDVFHASTRRFWEAEFADSPDNLATWTHRLTNKPVITVGSVGLDKAFSLEQFQGRDYPSIQFEQLRTLADQLEQNKFDLVAVGRALLSEPEWANKVRSGHYETIKNFSHEALTTLVV
ncbi:NADH:flavin oxidoreductase [Beggiatoa leptomitoformis]|uniref:12-oxophytodienoate reductase n=1 Tax=Beggiatoa leptomitoformis TaxID=288004 RepID=A0A2N9YG58_9GAMM|nr:NADH:flavin oxidoreductase [Beggiatoa leptomitoformis]ALG68310.1 12-oxophytodienoate reductase [Beggiatoa leptomitoformis]AUI69375.1 12-oxophytodienoate reductase [Beggiatoa leptomitoformis]